MRMLPGATVVVLVSMGLAGCDARTDRREVVAPPTDPFGEWAPPPTERQEIVLMRESMLAQWERDEMEAQTQEESAEALRDLLSLLPANWREGTEVVATEDRITLHRFPSAARLRLWPQARFGRINELFRPQQSELGDADQTVRYWVGGNGTVRADHRGGGARPPLRAWLAQHIGAAQGVDFVLEDSCMAAGFWDLGVQVVAAPAPLEGAFLHGVTLGRGAYEGRGLLITLNEDAPKASRRCARRFVQTTPAST
ncbi:MAG: hypothetical protein AB8I08_23750 [Sandaracinaceae bacterium]